MSGGHEARAAAAAAAALEYSRSYSALPPHTILLYIGKAFIASDIARGHKSCPASKG